MRCCVEDCINDGKETSKNQGITFYPLPEDAEKRSLWISSLGIDVLDEKEATSVCSKHFKEYDFVYTKSGIKKVRSDAVPILEQSPEDLELPVTYSVCKICLSYDRKVYDLKLVNLEQVYKQLTGVTLEECRLPRVVCWECCHRLKSVEVFRKKAVLSHTLLKDTFNSNTIITVKDIATLNDTQIKSKLIQTISEPTDFDLQVSFENGIKIETYNEYVEEPVCAKNDETFTELDIKDEESNEIFFQDLDDNGNDNFESDDDKKLSEIYPEAKTKEKKKKVVRKVAKKREDMLQNNPDAAVTRYRTSYIQRRSKSRELGDFSLFTITSLTYDEQIKEIEARQESHIYKNAPFKCTVCYRGFMGQERYENHCLRHSEKLGPFECFICKTRMKTSKSLRKHLTGQHTEKYCCKGCSFTTRNRGVARDHERWHEGIKYKCPHCELEFDKITTYLGHVRIKHISDFVCALCGFTFISQKGITVHKQKKHKLDTEVVPEDGPYCELCGIRFMCEEAFDRHLKLSSKHTMESDPNRLRNDSQNMYLEGGRRRKERRPRLIRSKESIPWNEQGSITCEQCGIQLSDLRVYAQHFRRVHPDKNRTKFPRLKTPCMCDQCGRIFQSMAQLKDHMWVHTGVKRFACTKCPKSFTQKTNLLLHEKVHSSTRPSYECPVCGKHFSFFNNRRRHMFIHTGLKPHKCETCSKCFTTTSELRAHVDHVHMKKPWPKRSRRRDDTSHDKFTED